ncbi:LacI family DNA-binding transcriptional regulator [Granulosicoccus sp. 3-233]|uniref:LacI family DNA-binding transcriptional regulator n=1 Tax=Granulosicoccus sp. 3-233 TaxID=3417969 RepID=UPI003D337226
MAGEKITSSQVARLAGVSQSAVSRVFTPGASVSPKTADKVRAAANELGYRPNVLARSLITGKSRIIGLVVSYLNNQFYPEVLEKLSNGLQAKGYHVLVFMAAQTAGNIDEVLEEILDYQADGIVLASVAMSSELALRSHAAGVPVVLFNRTQDNDLLSSITADNVAGGRKVADHLVQAGYQRIAYIAGWEGASTQRDRETGFREGLAAAGVQLFAREEGDFHFEQAKLAARRMFSVDDRPDAVFVCNDHMAFAVMDVLRDEMQLRVPEDVAVVGYDDVPAAAWGAYKLTTVRQPANRMVEETITTLLTQIEHDDTPPRRLSIDGPLVVRSTSVKP